MPCNDNKSGYNNYDKRRGSHCSVDCLVAASIGFIAWPTMVALEKALSMHHDDAVRFEAAAPIAEILRPFEKRPVDRMATAVGEDVAAAAAIDNYNITDMRRTRRTKMHWCKWRPHGGTLARMLQEEFGFQLVNL
eukprot:scaffold2541_cov175-Amphora_coffeaeformis.AAC.12